MARIKVQKAPTPKKGGKSQSLRELYATLCWYYKQYTLEDAQQLSARDLNLLIKTAQKQEARMLMNLTQIAAAPHTKDGAGVKSLMKQYEGMVK